MCALQEFSARNCELVSPLRGISCASGKLSRLQRSIFLAPPALVFGVNCLELSLWQKLWRRGKKYTWDLSYSEGKGEATLKRRVSFWSVTMTFPSKVQPAGGCFELQTLYGACRVFLLKSSKSQDILVKIGCFTQNGDLSNTHTPTPAHIHKFKFGFLHFGAVVSRRGSRGEARRARAPPLLRQKKKRGEKGKGKKRKRKGERERET